VRTLLAGSSLLPSAWDVGGLAGILVEQVEVGSVVKTAASDSDAAADDDVLGFMSAINLHTHRGAKCVQQIIASVLQRAADAKARDAIQKLLDDTSQPAALVVSERMLNMPPALVPSLVDSLLQDIEWAAANAPKAERASFRFGRLLFLAQAAVADGAQVASSSSAPDLRAPGGKKRKKASSEAQAALVDSLEFVRPEEQLLASSADYCTLLNGAGRSRQLLMCVTLEAVREAIPALSALMTE